MRYVEDQGDGRSRSAAAQAELPALVALAVAAVGIAYAVGAGLQSGDPLMSGPMAVAAAFHLGWAGWALLHRNKPLLSVGAAVVAGFALVVGAPALAGGHYHDHDSGPAAGAASGDEASAEPPRGESEPGDSTSPEPGDAGGYRGHGDHGDPVVSLYDPRLTDEQRQAARRLIDETTAGMERYPDVDSVVAAGYLSIGDAITGFEHFIHPGYMSDGLELDPERIESIVARVNPDGSKEVVSAMYLMSAGSTMDDVPDIAGPLTIWHDHQDLCWDGLQVVGRTGPDGSCARGELRGTAPMLHVWLVPHPCGPFAGLEGHGGSCAHEH